ncbi:hypothetical protein J2128_001255 [Methanomicrobium sp. W14]|uniref:hypothetical protein n=1 Tax=Methanomicrobium sp. W14 TaxID=2817839 RepID=UPI001AE99BF8|nr:hypothetical protein [Methanomicrobium sp. W14]MBP2133301.1 hypothetical protein [Methanomicrobium sp. W14]
MSQNNNSIASVYFAIIGIAAVALGIADILVWSGISGGIDLGIMSISGDDFFRWAWGGLVVLFGGILILSGCSDIRYIQQFSKVLLGSIMIWVIAGCDIFAMICGGIPAPKDAPEFLNSFSGFLGYFMPPYAPAVILLPFTLAALYLYYRWGFAEKAEKD